MCLHDTSGRVEVTTVRRRGPGEDDSLRVLSPEYGVGGNLRVVNDVSLEHAYRDTFADLLRNPSGSWSTVRDVRAFLFGAVTNRARMYHRQNERRRHRDLLLVATSHVAADDAGGDSRVGLSEAFEELSVQQRAVIVLTYWQDLPVAEVARVLGVGDGTVRRQLARARSRLRGALS
jgi:RNA polymerase sigma factor (sigma-70 family)